MLRSMFKNPKPPQQQTVPNQPQQATPTPTIDQAAQLAEEQNRLRRRKGRQQYMLTRPQQVATPTVATKTLTGQ